MNISTDSYDIYKFFRICIYTAEILILFSIEQNIGFTPEVYGGRPVLILPLFIVISVFEGSYLGIAWGFLSGLLLDLSFCRNIKTQILIMGIAGYLIGKAGNKIRNNIKDKIKHINFICFIVMSLIFIPLLIGLRFYMNYMIKGIEYADTAFYNHVIPSIIYTLALSPLIYFLNRPIWFFIN